VLKVGIIGTGGIARSHIRGYQEFPDQCEIVAMCDIFPQKIQDEVSEFGLSARAYTSHAEMLAAEDLDLVSVATPPKTHAPITIDCLNSGVNVLVEKPMALSLTECDAMLAAAKESGKLLSVVAQNRFRNDMVILKDAIDSGLIGPITHMQVNSSWWRGRAYYDLWWRGTWASEGGGATLSQAVHHVDLTLWMAGRPKAVTAVLANAAHDNSEVEDLSVAILHLDRGLATITSSVVDHGEEQSIIVHGEKARVSQPWKVVTSVAQPNGFPTPDGDPELAARLESISASHTPLAHEGHAGQIGDVLAAIREGRPPAVTGEDGRAGIELVTAIYESGNEHRTVDLPLTPADPYYRGELAARAHHFYEKEKSVEDLDGFITLGGSPDPAQRTEGKR